MNSIDRPFKTVSPSPLSPRCLVRWINNSKYNFISGDRDGHLYIWDIRTNHKVDIQIPVKNISKVKNSQRIQLFRSASAPWEIPSLCFMTPSISRMIWKKEVLFLTLKKTPPVPLLYFSLYFCYSPGNSRYFLHRSEWLPPLHLRSFLISLWPLWQNRWLSSFSMLRSHSQAQFYTQYQQTRYSLVSSFHLL